MANVESSWSAEHRRAVKEMEERLGREICGVPTDEGPCSQWPISDSHGRCRSHARDAEAESGISRIFGGNPDEDSRSEAPVEVFPGSPSLWASLALAGLILGGGIMGGLVYYDVLWIPRSLAMVEQTQNNDRPERETQGSETQVSMELNLQKPDFTRIRTLYREGNVDQVAVALERIVRKAPRESDRAHGMYLQFVLYQNQGDYDRALRIADRFLDEFEEHDRRPEILFGAAFLCQRFLDRADRARRYKRRLRQRYPESPWTRRLSSLS